MERYQNILCATDFSNHCRAAAERAADMAARYGAQLTLLHVVEYFPVDRSNVEIAPENVDPAALAQGVAVFAATAFILADMPDFPAG